MTIHRKITLVALIVLTMLLLLLLPSHTGARAAALQGKWVSGSATNAFGIRAYKLWVPPGYTGRARVPLVLMLHGCTQTAEGFAAGTGMNAVADANNFLVAYAEQTQEANPLRCWNWFMPEHQTRDAGEPSLLAAIVRQIAGSHKVDERRVYVAGISAGAAMSVILGAAYPDMFAAMGVSAGLEYKAATNVAEALAAQPKGGPDPNEQGRLAFQALSNVHSVGRKHRAALIVFQGTLDVAVAPVNADQVISQWAQTNDYLDDGADNNSVDDAADATTNGAAPGGYAYVRSVYYDKTRKPLMEKWVVQGMKHAWSGGSAAGSYTDAKGPDASAEMWRFFRSYKLDLPRIERKGAKP